MLKTLGRLGASVAGVAARSASEERDAVRELEAVGYDTLWFSEANTTREAFVHAALLLGWTERVAVATSIASIWARDASAAANGARGLGEAYPGRFALGLGVSHAPVVVGRGHDYSRPLTAMREYLDGMEATKYDPPAPSTPVPTLLAALAPRMIELARERADGIHPMLVTPDHTAWARQLLGAGPVIAVKQPVLLVDDADEARRIARESLAPYLGLPNYSSAWRRLGFDDADFVNGSDRLVDALVAWGDEDAVRTRFDAQFAAGADHVVVNPIGPDQLGQLTRLAALLRG